MSSDLGKFVLYADDTNIFISGNSEADYIYAKQLHINVKKVVKCILDMNILIKRDLFVLEQTELTIDYFL